jgi:hypothetical protein
MRMMSRPMSVTSSSRATAGLRLMLRSFIFSGRVVGPEDTVDLNAHLHGGIPDHDLNPLSSNWAPSAVYPPTRPL